MEEFQESDVIWSNHHHHRYHHNHRSNVDDKENGLSPQHYSRLSDTNQKSKTKTKKNTSNSIPINIPSSISKCSSWSNQRNENDHFEDDGEEMVPPHLMVARRINAENMTNFSVCTGTGRTLKGRDLRKVRNSVLRMTGFLET